MSDRQRLVRLGAIAMAFGVALGAFGAHDGGEGGQYDGDLDATLDVKRHFRPFRIALSQRPSSGALRRSPK